MKNYLNPESGYVFTEEEAKRECESFYAEAGHESPETYFNDLVEKGALVETNVKILIHGMPLDNETLSNIASYMDDEIREELHSKLAVSDPTIEDNEEFLNAYLEKDPDFLELLENEFNFERI